MIYRKLTADGDYSFGGSEKDFYRDVPAAVGQAAETRLMLWLGEWYLDLEEGTPYLQSILGKHSQATADAAIQDRILGTQGMVGIENYQSILNADDRFLSASTEINTIYGATLLEIQNYSLV